MSVRARLAHLERRLGPPPGICPDCGGIEVPLTTCEEQPDGSFVPPVPAPTAGACVCRVAVCLICHQRPVGVEPLPFDELSP